MNRFDRRTFMVGQNLNDESFMNMVFFLRYFAFGGSVDSLVQIKMVEVQRKVDAREPFTDQTSFDGTRVKSYSKEMETIVWQMIGSNCDAKLKAFGIDIKKAQEMIKDHNEGKTKLADD